MEHGTIYRDIRFLYFGITPGRKDLLACLHTTYNTKVTFRLQSDVPLSAASGFRLVELSTARLFGIHKQNVAGQKDKRNLTSGLELCDSRVPPASKPFYSSWEACFLFLGRARSKRKMIGDNPDLKWISLGVVSWGPLLASMKCK